MTGSQHAVIYNCFGKFREPLMEGLFCRNSKYCEGANESLPFFVGGKERVNGSCDTTLINIISNFLKLYEGYVVI
jgi:hypothetical protein